MQWRVGTTDDGSMVTLDATAPDGSGLEAKMEWTQAALMAYWLRKHADKVALSAEHGENFGGDTVDCYDELECLPEGTVIRCEIEEYEGLYELTNPEGCCGGWHDFVRLDDGSLEIGDDYTPELPAVIVAMGH